MSNQYAVAVIAPNTNGVSGTVYFQERKSGLEIKYEIQGLKDGEHGFHIHEYGDLTDGCTSACDHFNPFNETHGGLHSETRHEGDLGNIISEKNKAYGKLIAPNLSLDFNKKTCVVGRMIIVHEDRDDLGLGGDAESLKTGNAGKRLGCGVIGLQEPPKNSSSGAAESLMEAERKPDESVSDWQKRYEQESLVELLKATTFTSIVFGLSGILGFFVAPKLINKGSEIMGKFDFDNLLPLKKEDRPDGVITLGGVETYEDFAQKEVGKYHQHGAVNPLMSVLGKGGKTAQSMLSAAETFNSETYATESYMVPEGTVTENFGQTFKPPVEPDWMMREELSALKSAFPNAPIKVPAKKLVATSSLLSLSPFGV
jgi:superoxide dismutase, Cu-Zn family